MHKPPCWLVKFITSYVIVCCLIKKLLQITVKCLIELEGSREWGLTYQASSNPSCFTQSALMHSPTLSSKLSQSEMQTSVHVSSQREHPQDVHTAYWTWAEGGCCTQLWGCNSSAAQQIFLVPSVYFNVPKPLDKCLKEFNKLIRVFTCQRSCSLSLVEFKNALFPVTAALTRAWPAKTTIPSSNLELIPHIALLPQLTLPPASIGQQ